MFVVNSRGSGPDCKRVLCESTMSPCCFCTAYVTHTDCIRTVDRACVKQALRLGHTACDADVERVCCVTAAEKNPLHFYYVGPHLIRAYSAGSVAALIC